MKRLFAIYGRSCRNMVTTGRTYARYVTDPLIAIGIPLSAVFLILTLLATVGISSLAVDGEELTGRDALLPGLAAALLGIPAACIFTGTLMWVCRELLKLP